MILWETGAIKKDRTNKCVSNDSLSIKGVDTGDDVGAVPAHQEVHSFVESL